MYLDKKSHRILRSTFLLLALVQLLSAQPLKSDIAQDSGWAQDPINYSFGIFPKEAPSRLYNFNVSGFYRFFGTYTQQQQPYALTGVAGDVVQDNNLFIGDDSFLPNFLINISGRPNRQVSWGFDVFAFQFLDGVIQPAYSGQVATENRPSIWDPINGTRLGSRMNLNLGINLFGSFSTDYGTFNVRMGGINWYSMTDLTFSSFRGYNRNTLFERNPWDPIGNSIGERYEQLYATGEVSQDERWGERAFQGLIFEGMALPNDWSFAVLYGKAEINGGFLTIPNTSYGGQLAKSFNNRTKISLNTINSQTYADSLNESAIRSHVVTADFDFDRDKFRLQFEIGGGQYITPDIAYDVAEAINLKFLAKKELTGIPIEFHVFRINPRFVNNNAVSWNVATTEINPNDAAAGTVGSNAVLRPFASSLLPVGLTTNNRQGANVNTFFNWGKLHLSLGLGAASEIEAISNQITFDHPVNQLTRSRFWRWNFPQNVGPYERQSVIFRNVFETVNILESPIVEKRFSTLETHLKYKMNVSGKPLYLFFLGRYQSVQQEWSPIPVFASSAYLRQYSNEIEAYWGVRKGLFLNAYGGYERTLGNYATDIDVETVRPRDQEGWGAGIGLDQTLGRNAALFIRHRWFYFYDKSFRNDFFEGQETIVELKVFF